MAFKFQFFFFFLLFCVSTISVSQGGRVDNIAEVLSDAGYSAMSLTLQITFPTLIPQDLSNSTITIFCPSDQAFFSLDYPQPPLTLLQYHVAPMKLEREDLESSLPTGSKIDTLLLGHPLVVTTEAYVGNASINNVEIKEWDVYNDGRVVVHGVEKFFDPSFQTLEYPWYDNPSNDSGSVNTDVSSPSSNDSGSVNTDVSSARSSACRNTWTRKMQGLLFVTGVLLMLS